MQYVQNSWMLIAEYIHTELILNYELNNLLHNLMQGIYNYTLQNVSCIHSRYRFAI